jgi:hypothetical protein
MVNVGDELRGHEWKVRWLRDLRGMEFGRKDWCGRRDSAFERLNLFRLRLYFFRIIRRSIEDLLKPCRTIVTIYRE